MSAPVCAKRQDNRSVGASSARCGVGTRGIDANMEGKAGRSKLGDCAPALPCPFFSCHILAAVRGQGKREGAGQLSCSSAPAFFRQLLPSSKPASKRSGPGTRQQLAISPRTGPRINPASSPRHIHSGDASILFIEPSAIVVMEQGTRASFDRRPVAARPLKHSCAESLYVTILSSKAQGLNHVLWDADLMLMIASQDALVRALRGPSLAP
jgi:hypothetical protein